MKVVVISPVLPPVKAGEADYAAHLCLQLARAGHEVHVVTSRQTVVMHPESLTLHPVLTDCGWGDVPAVWMALRRIRPQAIVHLYLGWIYNGHPMATYLPWIAKRCLPQVRFLCVFYNRIGASKHSNARSTRWLQKFFSFLVGREDSGYEFGTLLTASDEIVAFCQKHLDFLISVEPSVRTTGKIVPPPPLLPLHPDPQLARQTGRRRLHLSDGNFAVTFFGYLYPGKGGETLLAAFALLLKNLPQARLIFVGGVFESKGTEDAQYGVNLRVLAKDLGIAEKITWAGGYLWDSDEASQFLYASDVAVFPFDVGIALNNSSVAAAAAHGLPLISTRGESLEPAFREGENILLCPPKSAEPLAVHLQAVAQDAALRQRLSHGALRLAEAQFSWEGLLSQFDLAPVARQMSEAS